MNAEKIKEFYLNLSDNFLNYNDSDFDQRMKLAEEIRNTFPEFEKWEVFRLWEMSRNFIQELKEINHSEENILSMEVSSLIESYSENTFFEAAHLYPEKYWAALEDQPEPESYFEFNLY